MGPGAYGEGVLVRLPNMPRHRDAASRASDRCSICEAVSWAGPVPRISSSILSEMRWAASRSYSMVQSAAYLQQEGRDQRQRTAGAVPSIRRPLYGDIGGGRRPRHCGYRHGRHRRQDRDPGVGGEARRDGDRGLAPRLQKLLRGAFGESLRGGGFKAEGMSGTRRAETTQLPAA